MTIGFRQSLSYHLHVEMESSPGPSPDCATPRNLAIRQSMELAASPSLLNFTDPLLLNHWYQLQLHRLQTEQYSIGLPNYLSQGTQNTKVTKY